MMETDYACPHCFTVRYKELGTWNVSAQFIAKWHWPDNFIRPLSRILKKRTEIALESVSSDSVVRLLTIRFDGSIELREPICAKSIKGKLFKVYPGDVVFSKIDIRHGAIGLAPDSTEHMCVTAEFPVYVVNKSEADSAYIKRLFHTTVFKKLLNSMISGTSGRKRIHPSQLESLKVPIPPLSIQQEIVEYWETAQKERCAAERDLSNLVTELDLTLTARTNTFERVTGSHVFLANYMNMQQWDAKAGRAAAFIMANPDFVRLGDYTVECTETVKPWNDPEKEWPIYGVNNKEGVFLNSRQLGKDFNAAYKKIEKDYFFHNPTRSNVGSLGIVPDVPSDAITSPEYQVWRLTGGFLPGFMDLILKTNYFLALVAFNRVGAVKQRMYYANMAEIRLPQISESVQRDFVQRRLKILENIRIANEEILVKKNEIEQMILGLRPVEVC